MILAVIAAIWEIYARWLNNALLVPTFSATVEALAAGVASGTILARTASLVGHLVEEQLRPIGFLLSANFRFLESCFARACFAIGKRNWWCSSPHGW